jgi:hypothetical protein
MVEFCCGFVARKVIRMSEFIRVETKITYQDLKNFTWFNILKKGKYYKPANIVTAFIVVFSIIYIIYEIYSVGFEGFFASTAVYFIAVPLVPPAFYFLHSYTMKKNYKQSRVQYDSVHRFEFHNDYMKMESNGGNMTGTSVYQYDAIYRVLEVKDAYYIYANPVHAHMIAKRDMDGATKERLAQLFKTKLGKKFIRCY